jgi:hypothetical protein
MRYRPRIRGSRWEISASGKDESETKNGARGPDLTSVLERRFKKIPPSRYSPTQEMCSTIAEAGLNFRVRNGNGCGPRSMDGGKTLSLFPVPLIKEQRVYF